MAVAALVSSRSAAASDASRAARIWIDTDAACGYRATADPDDCFALLMLAEASQVVVAGVSTVFGNAPLADTDRIARRVLERSKRSDVPPGVHRGFAHALEAVIPEPVPEGVLAIRRALREGPLRIVALGPLTNIAAAIRDDHALAQNIVDVVAVMGKREGHLFHPSEGARLNLLFGHGPIFRDVNFTRDVLAARILMKSGVHITLLPYELARQLSLTEADMARFERAGGTLGWVARSSRGWLAYWRALVGRDGFYPFDLLAAAYVIEDRHFGCELEPARVAMDRKVGPLFRRSASLLVGIPRSRDDEAIGPALDVTYCTVAHPGLRPWLLAQLDPSRSARSYTAPDDELASRCLAASQPDRGTAEMQRSGFTRLTAETDLLAIDAEWRPFSIGRHRASVRAEALDFGLGAEPPFSVPCSAVQFPCSSDLSPCSAERIPCSSAQGILAQVPESAG